MTVISSQALVPCLLVLFLGCSQSKPQPANPTPQESQKPAAQTIKDDPAAQKILRDAEAIDSQYDIVKREATHYLSNHQPQDETEKGICLRITVVCAGAHYLAGDTQLASTYADKAFSLSPYLIFPESWAAVRWIKRNPQAPTVQLVRMKHFILSRKNGGLDDLRRANESFIGKAQYDQGIYLYRQALMKGIEEDKPRCSGYLGLSACLFKKGQTEEAESAFLEAWIADRNVQLEFMDPQTKDYLLALRKKYGSLQ